MNVTMKWKRVDADPPKCIGRKVLVLCEDGDMMTAKVAPEMANGFATSPCRGVLYAVMSPVVMWASIPKLLKAYLALEAIKSAK